MMNDDPSMRDRALTDAGGDSGPVGVAGGQAGAPGRSADARTGKPAPSPAGRDGAPVPVPAGADDAAPVADDEEGGEPRKRRSFWRELPVLVVVALVIALLIKTFVVQAFFIPSSSMENTLEVYDKVLVNKLVYHFRSIQPGDVVVFSGAGSWDPVPPPAKPSSDPVVRLYDATMGRLLHSISGLFGTVPGQTDYIKRVIGVPGDRVACCTAGGLVTVNGVPLHESSYLFPGAQPSQIHFRIKVPPGRLWVMGDNRYVSADSRLHRQSPGSGTVPENKVIGRAFLIVWPPSRWGVLPIPSTFSQPGVNRTSAAPAGAAGTAGTAGQVASAGPAVVVMPSQSPLLPLAAGLAGAVPLTWLSRRLRLRPRRRRQGYR
jgi:signal peptidase I